MACSGRTASRTAQLQVLALLMIRNAFLDTYLACQWKEYIEIFHGDQIVTRERLATRLQWLLKRFQMIRDDHLKCFPDTWCTSTCFLEFSLGKIGYAILHAIYAFERAYFLIIPSFTLANGFPADLLHLLHIQTWCSSARPLPLISRRTSRH